MIKSYYFFFLSKNTHYFFVQLSVSTTRVNRLIHQQSFWKKKNYYFGHLIPFAINLSSTVKRFEKCSYVLYIEMPRRFLVNWIAGGDGDRQKKSTRRLFGPTGIFYTISVRVSETFRARIPRVMVSARDPT